MLAARNGVNLKGSRPAPGTWGLEGKAVSVIERRSIGSRDNTTSKVIIAIKGHPQDYFSGLYAEGSAREE